MPDMMLPEDDHATSREFSERRWIPLDGSHDIETWIDHANRDLQRVLGSARAEGCGLAFRLELGGEIFLHTTEQGEILLDVPPEAQWAAPAIAAATGSAAPAGQVWLLPGHLLTQLLFGLNSLIAATRLVASHDFGLKKSWKSW